MPRSKTSTSSRNGCRSLSLWRFPSVGPGSQILSLGQPHSSLVQGGATAATCSLQDGLTARTWLAGAAAPPFHPSGDNIPSRSSMPILGCIALRWQVGAASCFPTSTCWAAKLQPRLAVQEKARLCSHPIERNWFTYFPRQNKIYFTTVN